MIGVNKTIIVGNLGQDPEMRYLPSGSAVTNISVATSESWTDQQGQKQELVEWHKIIFFNRLAEIANEYLRKGSKVYIEGSLRTNSWEKDGLKHYSTEIVAREMKMLDSRNDQQQSRPQKGSQRGNQSNSYQAGKDGSARPAQQPRTPKNMDKLDDDIPF